MRFAQRHSGLLLHVGRGARRHETTDRVGRWAGPLPSRRPRWSARADTALAGRAGPWGWRHPEARLGCLPTGAGGRGGLAQARLTTAQASTKAQHSARAPRLLAGQGGSPTSHSPFPTQLISHHSGSTAGCGAGPTPGERPRAPLG